jgi:hypothetical protein
MTITIVAIVVLVVCVAGKVYIIHNSPSHPLFRVSPLFTHCVDFKKGQRVRLVRMDGCMAHIRGDVRGGAIVEMLETVFYGSSQVVPVVRIRMDNDALEERVALRSQWTLHDGLWEYRY